MLVEVGIAPILRTHPAYLESNTFSWIKGTCRCLAESVAVCGGEPLPGQGSRVGREESSLSHRPVLCSNVFLQSLSQSADQGWTLAGN